MLAEVPDYERLQSELVAATHDIAVTALLELGTGTGETVRRTLDAHPNARLVGIDSSEAMLGRAREVLPAARVELFVRRLEDPLPAGTYDLVISALAVHHLHDPQKADLFERVHDALSRGGRFVLADCVEPERPEDVVTPPEPDYDFPSPIADQLRWLEEAGFAASVNWAHKDLAVLVADRIAA